MASDDPGFPNLAWLLLYTQDSKTLNETGCVCSVLLGGQPSMADDRIAEQRPNNR